MKQVLLVGTGGFLGAVLRYGLGLFVLGFTKDWRFPLPTVLVNVLGCLAAGMLAGVADKHQFFGPDARLFLFVGLLGGFTTFSAFGMETVNLLERHESGAAFMNVAVSVGVGLFALWVGMRVAGR